MRLGDLGLVGLIVIAAGAGLFGLRRMWPGGAPQAVKILATIAACAVALVSAAFGSDVLGASEAFSFLITSLVVLATAVVTPWALSTSDAGAPSKRPAPPPLDPAEAADVFISYRREDRDAVLGIARALSDLGMKVWFDADLRSGTAFDAQIERQLRSARCVLVCWSPAAVQSEWVRAEATIGRERDVLCAVFLQPCQLPPPFNLVHTSDLSSRQGSATPLDIPRQGDPGPAGQHEPHGQEWDHVVQRIRALVGR